MVHLHSHVVGVGWHRKALAPLISPGTLWHHAPVPLLRHHQALHITRANTSTPGSSSQAPQPAPQQHTVQKAATAAASGKAAHQPHPGAGPLKPPPVVHTQLSSKLGSDEYETEYVTETEEASSELAEEQQVVPASQATIPSKVAPNSAPATAAASEARQQAAFKPAAPAAPQPVATASMVAASQSLSPAMQQSVSGWVVAACLLLAARLSRDEADAERRDLQALQVRQAESRVQSAELRALRRAFLEQERVRKEEEAAKRLEEARKRSEAEAIAKAAREKAYQEKAAAETARLWAEQQAARQEFLAAEARMSEELAKRTEVEVALREAELARKKEEEERKRRAYEADLARRAAEAAKRAEEERVRQEQEAARHREERRRLRAAQTRFSLRVGGRVIVQQSAPGTTSSSTCQPVWQTSSMPAKLTVQVAMQLDGAERWVPGDSQAVQDAAGGADSSSGGSGRVSPSPSRVSSALGARFGLPSSGGAEQRSDDGVISVRSEWKVEDPGMTQRREAFISPVAAVDCSSDMSELVANPLLDKLWDSIRASGVVTTPTGPSEGLVDLELKHWRRVSAARCEVALRKAVSQVAPLYDPQPLEQPFQVLLPRAVLPPSHERSMPQQMAKAVQGLLDDNLESVVNIINSAIEEEGEMLASGAGSGGAWLNANYMAGQSSLPPLTLQCLVYANLIDYVTHAPTTTSPPPEDPNQPQPASEGSSQQQDGSWLPAINELQVGEVVEQVVRLASYQMSRSGKFLASDVLLDTATCVKVALGHTHPLTKAVVDLADKNMSDTTRVKLELRKQQAEMEAVTAQIISSSPASAQLDPNSLSARDSLVPIPERLWAARNVASSMVRFGDTSQASEALSMLVSACDLAASHYGPKHPSCAGVLLDTRDALKTCITKCDDPQLLDSLQTSFTTVTSSLVDVIKAVGGRFTAGGDALSAALLYESALKELGPVDADSLPAVLDLQRTTLDLMYSLKPNETRVVISKRTSKSSILRTVAREFTEELGVYSTSTRRTRLDQWKESSQLTPIR